jgi:glutamine amidotransferase
VSTVALVDAGGANLGSVRVALERLGVRVRLARDADDLRGAGHVLLPGVGSAAHAMALLRERGLAEVLGRLEVPLLGICLGMQLLFDASDEGDVACLGLLPGRVRRLPSAPGLRVPHMGWNTLEPRAPSRLLAGLDRAAQFYFVHGYAAPASAAVATCRHGDAFAAVVEQGLVAGTQFHPERSAGAGARVLANFLGWRA